MRILSPVAVGAFDGRIVNVHPSLLPAFPGAHAVRDALEWGVKITGCTVHLVDEEVDHGPILAQEAVPVLEGDDETKLHARIQAVEHRLYPATVQAWLEGGIRVEGRRASRGEEART
jgi:phosphoribosylglycinamide formyltransferase 1